MPGSGHLGAVLWGHGRRGNSSTAVALGKAGLQRRPGGLEDRGMGANCFSHHCDQTHDKNQCMGGWVCFRLWFEGAESTIRGRGRSPGSRSQSLGFLKCRQTKKCGEVLSDAQFAFPFVPFIQSRGPSPQDDATHFQEGSSTSVLPQRLT